MHECNIIAYDTINEYTLHTKVSKIVLSSCVKWSSINNASGTNHLGHASLSKHADKTAAASYMYTTS